MSFVDDGWEADFPRVMHFFDQKNVFSVPSKLLKDKDNFPDYHAAKWEEDSYAAARLVMQLLNTPENTLQLHELKRRHPDAILVPVRAIEAGGKNKIPLALAEYISKKSDLMLMMCAPMVVFFPKCVILLKKTLEKSCIQAPWL